MRLVPNLIIAALRRNQDQVRLTARELGISPGTVRLWRKRAATGQMRTKSRYSTAGLARRSTVPKSRRRTTLSAQDQDRIVALRAERELGAIKITRMLKLSCHPKTVHRFLKRKGLVHEGTTYRRPRYQPTKHMHTRNATQPGKLQMDVKVVTPELSGILHTCYLYGVMDIWSRYKQGVILPGLDQRLSIMAVDHLIYQLPFDPDFIQTDNGLEFQRVFHDHVITNLGLEHHYIHKSSPNENAVIERSFRTDEEEFFWRIDEPLVDFFDFNDRYQAFLEYYNGERPHLGLDLQTPLQRLESFLSVQ